MANTQTRSIAVLAAGLACLAFRAVPARADANPTPRPGVSFGGRAAYIWNKNVDASDGDYFGGAQLRFYMAKFFAIEGSADYRQQRFTTRGPIVDVFPVQISGLLYLLPDSPVAPFILGGVGWYHTRVRGPGDDDVQNRFGSHAGGGLHFFLARHWSFDATYRYLFTNRITTRSGDGTVSINGNGHMVTGGLNFHF